MSSSAEIDKGLTAVALNYYEVSYLQKKREVISAENASGKSIYEIALQIATAKKAIPQKEASLPPHTITKTTISGKLISSSYNATTKVLSVTYNMANKPTAVEDSGEVYFVKPNTNNITSVVFIFPEYYNRTMPGAVNASKVNKYDQHPNVYISRWGLQQKANTTNTLFVIPKMNESVYESDVYANGVTWSSNKKIPGLVWVSEVLIEYINEEYFNGGMNVDLFAVGVGIGANGAIKFGNKLQNIIKGVIGLSGYYDIVNPDSPESNPYTSLKDMLNMHTAVFGTRQSNAATWKKEDISINVKNSTYPIRVYSEASPEGTLTSKFVSNFAAYGNIKGVYGFVNNTGRDWDFWGNVKVVAQVFKDIKSWTTLSTTDNATKKKTAYLSKIKAKMAGYGTAKKATKPDNPETLKLIDKVCFEELKEDYIAYLSALGIVTQTQEIQYSDNQIKLLDAQIRSLELKREHDKIKERANSDGASIDDMRKYAKDLQKNEAEQKKALEETSKILKLVRAEGKESIYSEFLAQGKGSIESLKSESKRIKAIKKFTQQAVDKQKQIDNANKPDPLKNLTIDTPASLVAKSDSGSILKTVVAKKVEAVEEAAKVENTTEDTELFIGKDPLAAQIDTPTQLLKGDFMDARRYETILPVFYQSEVPAYITLKDDIGAPGRYSNKELGISKEAATTKTKTPPDIHDPFKGGSRYNQLIITGLTEAANEKYQVVDTMAQGQVIFSFGHKPEIWSIQGNLINDIYVNWLAKFREIWEEHLRLSKLVEHGKYARFVIPSLRIAFNGYPLGYSINHNSTQEQFPSFSMMIFIREVKNFSVFPFDVNTSAPSLASSLLYADGVKF